MGHRMKTRYLLMARVWMTMKKRRMDNSMVRMSVKMGCTGKRENRYISSSRQICKEISA
jgi:hypothetical protein